MNMIIMGRESSHKNIRKAKQKKKFDTPWNIERRRGREQKKEIDDNVVLACILIITFNP